MQPVREPPVRLRWYTMAFGLIALYSDPRARAAPRTPVLLGLRSGQFVPASLDLFRAGAWIPVSTVPNVHPPGVMAYLALFWKIFGYSIRSPTCDASSGGLGKRALLVFARDRTGAWFLARLLLPRWPWLSSLCRCFSRSPCWLSSICPRCACDPGVLLLRTVLQRLPSHMRFWFW